MMCSALLRDGIGRLGTVRDGLIRYMDAKGYPRLGDMRGVLSQKNCPEPAAFQRANHMKALTAFGPTSTFE